MLDLYLSELRRFRLGAIVYGVASLLILTLLNQLMVLPTGPVEGHFVLLLLYMISGLGFALYQFGTYRQPSRWIWLQHRPMHRSRILAAIALASVTLMVLAAALPLLVVLFSQDHFTSRVIDQRHYAGAVFLVLSALSAWLAGAYIVLHRSRWAFVILVLPILLTMHAAAWDVALAMAAACNVILLFLVYTVFRPNRYTGNDVTATVASAIPLQASFYLAMLWAGSTIFQVGQMLAGVHPLSSDHVLPGGYTEAARFESIDAVRAGLAPSTDPRAPAWRAALTEKNTAGVGPDVRQYAVRDVITTEGVLMFHDDAQRTWTFSHDRMMYRGMHDRSRASVGWYGAGGVGDTGAFDSQPFPLRDNLRHGYLGTAHDLYELLADGHHLRHVVHVDGREQLAGGIAVLGQRTALLTNRRLILLPSTGALPALLATVTLPVPFGELQRAEVAQVADGMLVTFIAGRRRLLGVSAAPQVTYLVDAGGKVQEVGRRELTHDFGVLFEHKDWWLSPALHALVALPNILIENGVVPDDGARRFEPLLRARPAAAWITAGVMALLSAAAALWWTRRTHLTARARLAWTVCCLLLGLPAFLSLMVLHPRAQADPSPARGAIPAAA